MESKNMSLTFEPRIPVMGQIVILEAVEFLYSLEALKEVGWMKDVQRLGSWQRFVATTPGKLLSQEHVLIVESARTGSVTEVVSGLAQPVERLLKFLFFYKAEKEAKLLEN